MSHRNIIYAFLWLLLLSCNEGRQVHTAFYYWKTSLNIGSQEMSFLRETKSACLYLRVFDIDLDPVTRQPVPVAMLNAGKVAVPGQELIPVVYLTQKCLLQLAPEAVHDLAARTGKLLKDICSRYKIEPLEIQLDCDWTTSTRNIYFAFLQELRKQDFLLERKLSCTIRMHQVKYAGRSGVPPVDKGMLMCYNMGNMKKYGGHNSILDVGETRDYMYSMQQYPLKLDIALPVFHWAVLFNRHQFKGIVYNILLHDFKHDQLLQVKDNLYRFTMDVQNKGYSFKRGEEIRFENPGQNDLENIARFAGQHINDTAFRVAFFHLDSAALGSFSPKDINSITDQF